MGGGFLRLALKGGFKERARAKEKNMGSEILRAGLRRAGEV